MTLSETTKARSDGEQKPAIPSISLPKGGGAIRGMGERFAANPVTGTGSMSVPIFASPGRSGFGPQLALSYDSGAGNGPFGFGWSLSLPSITRKTDKGLPQYRDAEESDVMILSGAEDLAPAFRPNTTQADAFDRDGYRVRRYWPRIEGLFARIERWTNLSDPTDVFWRSISKDNVTTFYGKSAESRIADAADPARIFSWLICQSYDDKGNAIVYDYQVENSDGIDLSQAHEKNRTTESRKANRYLKRVKYGNRTPNRDTDWHAADPSQLGDWMFEVVFDYEEGHYEVLPPDAQGRQFVRAAVGKTQDWLIRRDPFSSYRAGFEVRTCRLCQRVLMFHHFPDELGTPDYLLRSTEFTYNPSPIASFITEVTQSGYLRQPDGSYLKKSLPPLNFVYSEAEIHDEIETVDPDSLQNLSVGADGLQYQWLDLDGEGLQGVLSEQQEGWYYKRNLSPISTAKENGKEKVVARFEPLTEVATQPSIAEGASARHQFLDLAGDGNLDLVQFEKPISGFFERTEDEQWDSFTPFGSTPNVPWYDPNLRFVDLTGDGHADILVTEHDALTWYPSLAEEGFGAAVRVSKPRDEEEGPAVVFADGAQMIYVADLSGDGLSDIVRIRNGEICYWPNLGYGRFGAKVTMDNAPWFDAPDQFDPKRIRLADIDGSGTTDIIYLERKRVAIYRNECGNGWSPAEYLSSFPAVDDLSSVTALDLLGFGTACLVWSSSLPGNARRSMRYIDLMGGQKPHLLVKTVNNLGAETVVQYASSTKFYLEDKYAGKPWITRLPFPVHVVERVETRDLISRNRFVTRYAYHHGYYDGIEREFRGFGMVEQFDTEELAALTESNDFPDAVNIDAASYVPTVLTKTWFHTGAYIEGGRISRHFEDEYYHEGDVSEGVSGLTGEQLRAMLLPDTNLPTTLKRPDGSSIPWELTAEETREACRALKGAVLRREVYALDGTDNEDRPYSATEQNYTVELLQPKGDDKYAVFFTHPRESIDFHYERKLVEVSGKKIADPRVTHAMTQEVDGYGNVLKSVAIGYGRRPGLSPLQGDDREKQEQIHITYTENAVTNTIDEAADYRTPQPCESRTYELLKIVPGNNPPDITNLFDFDEIMSKVSQAGDGLHDLPYEDVDAAGATANHPYRRLIEHVRTLYRRNDLTSLLPLGALESLALPGERYKLAFTPGLLPQVFQRDGQPLLPNPTDVLGGQGADHGAYVDLDGDGHWWIPSGKVFFDVDADTVNPSITAPQELAEARTHFFLPRKFADPFNQSATADYDVYNLTIVKTQDALGNRVTALNDYRVLQPQQMTDPNGNRAEVAFDALGLVVATAVKGKVTQNLGDLLEDLEPDPPLAELLAFGVDPRGQAAPLLGKATTRILYDLDRYLRTGQAPYAATLARETHVSDLQSGQHTKIQIGLSYSDGFGREIQKKIQAEPGPVVEGGPIINPRWVGSGSTIFNNKGKPVRQYEPFFDDTHDFKFGNQVGVSPVLFYDPVERVVATFHPNHTYEKVVFDPWQQTTYDVNDTVTFDPRTDADVNEFFTRLPDEVYLPTWNQLRTDSSFSSAFAERYPDATDRANETRAARKAAAHAETPTTAHFDALGRPFLTVARNRVVCADHPLNGKPDEEFRTRVELDIEGNQRKVFDERKLPDAANLPLGALEQRIVMQYAYDMLGNRIHDLSMEAGARWMLNDVAGKPIRAWDGRGHNFTTKYGALRRLIEQTVRGTFSDPDPLKPNSDPRTLNRDILVNKIEYGEPSPNATPAQEAEAQRLNLRTRIYRHFDSAGIATNARLDAAGNPLEAYDFKGNLLRSTWRLARDYKSVPDWSQPPEPQLEAEFFEACTRYDALNRPIQSIAPHTILAGAERNVIQPVFNEANLLERVDVWLERAAEPGALLDPNTELASPVGVADIDYDAKGQRLRIDYKNGATTRYRYDPETFRLVHLYTRRGEAFTEDCDNPTPPPPTIAAPEQPPAVKGCGLQNLRYTYDPVGNITHIRDDAQQTIYFKNKRVEPSNDYVYDALYRLIQADGREHLGQVGGAPIPHSHDDAGRVGLLSTDAAGRFAASDGNAMGTYIERYVYDAVGNFLQMQHRGTDPAHPGWTRSYTYNEPSLIEGDKQSNRLSSTQVGNGITAAPETYLHDAHGNMLRMVHLGGGLPGPNMHWDYKDLMRQTDLGGGGTAFYVYDASGQRVRKVWEKAPGLTEERIYLGGFEVFRKRNSAGIVTLERETLHVMDDKQRIALAETRTQGNDGSPTQLIRYQFGNHLGSASLELDEQAQIISYEEYYPYGSTSYQAGRSAAEVSLKRYRYTGMERDEGTGFNYHGARYYAAWLGRWTRCDPVGLRAGLNLFVYANGSPILLVDPTGRDPEAPTFELPPPDVIQQRLREQGYDKPFRLKPGQTTQTLKLPRKPSRKKPSTSGGGVAGGTKDGVVGGDVGGNRGVLPQHGQDDDKGGPTRPGGGDPDGTGTGTGTKPGQQGVTGTQTKPGSQEGSADGKDQAEQSTGSGGGPGSGDGTGSKKSGWFHLPNWVRTLLIIGIIVTALVSIATLARAVVIGFRTAGTAGAINAAATSATTTVATVGGASGVTTLLQGVGHVAPPVGGGPSRLSANEVATGERLSNHLGVPLRESEHVGAEYVDDLGRSFDALGNPAASRYWNAEKFFRSIDAHLLKSNDFTAVDVTGFDAAHKLEVAAYLDRLPAAAQARIIRLGF